MDLVLRERLPLELVEIIMRYVWDMNMRDVGYIIKNNLVWIRADESYSFIISENRNYYEPLLWNIPEKKPKKSKKKNRNYKHIDKYLELGVQGGTPP